MNTNAIQKSLLLLSIFFTQACATSNVATFRDEASEFIDTPSVVVQQSLQDYKDHKLLKNNLHYGDSVRTLTLTGKTTIALDEELKKLNCSKKIDVIREPKQNKPIKDAHGKTAPIWIWLCADGGVVRAKPIGDPTSKYMPQPHVSKSLRYPVDSEYKGFESETIKIDNQGIAIPKWPADLKSKDSIVIGVWAKRAHTDLKN